MELRTTSRGGRALVHALLIVAIGGGIGAADWAIRKDRVNLKPRTTPPALVDPAPPTPAGPDAGSNGASTSVSKPAGVDQQPGHGDTPPPATPEAVETARPVPPAAATLPDGHITVAQASRLYDEGAFFVDARKKELYVAGHVAGAFRADMASFKTGQPGWVGALPKDVVLVAYCTGGDCDESEHVAELLDASGFKTIYVMHDGFPGWQAAGLPVEIGEGQE